MANIPQDTSDSKLNSDDVKGYTSIPNKIRLNFPPICIAVYLAIVDGAWRGNGACTKSIQTLCLETHLGHSSVGKALRTLEQYGFIKVIKVHNPKGFPFNSILVIPVPESGLNGQPISKSPKSKRPVSQEDRSGYNETIGW